MQSSYFELDFFYAKDLFYSIKFHFFRNAVQILDYLLKSIDLHIQNESAFVGSIFGLKLILPLDVAWISTVFKNAKALIRIELHRQIMVHSSEAQIIKALQNYEILSIWVGTRINLHRKLVLKKRRKRWYTYN